LAQGPQILGDLQVSFFRSNLMLRVVEKPTGKTPDGKPAVLEALVSYIKCADILLTTVVISWLSDHLGVPEICRACLLW
jgi:hypothetical protein